jgi:hypothetical protein
VSGQLDRASEGDPKPLVYGRNKLPNTYSKPKAPLESFKKKKKHIAVLLLNIREIGFNEVGTTCVFGG